MKALLRLFTALPLSETCSAAVRVTPEMTIPLGFILDPKLNIATSYLPEIEKIVGISGEKANQTFHKSWDKVANAPIKQLLMEQIMHYMTTYGFESIGVYDERMVYVPNEQLDVPEITEDIPLIYIKGFTREDILEAVNKMATAGIALHKDTLSDILDIVKEFKLVIDPDNVTNRELAIVLHKYYGTAPRDPEGFFRYMVFELTGETLIIKNHNLINKLKDCDAAKAINLLHMCPKDLGKIFYRYKPLFLALRNTCHEAKRIINQIRRKAPEQHVPMKQDYLNSVTELLAKGELDKALLMSELEKANIWRRIRLLYALNFRVNGGSRHIVHKIRNGKAWVKEFKSSVAPSAGEAMTALGLVAQSVINHIKPKVEGRVFYIPECISYALPATEKQFTGNFPSGTSVAAAEDLITGIHWTNVGDHRGDLDAP